MSPKFLTDVEQRTFSGAGQSGTESVDVDILTVRGEEFDAVLCGSFVDRAAAVPRVDEGAKSDPDDQAWLAGGGVPKTQMRNDTLRQIVRSPPCH